MKLVYLLLFFIILSSGSYSQRRFIKTNSDLGFGNAIRIIPAADKGWIVASMDSMRVARFDRCGKKLWSKKYNLPNKEPLLNDIILLSSGRFLLLTRIEGLNDNVCLITCFDSLGNYIWNKSYDDTYYEHYGYTLGEDATGNIFLFANVNQTSAPPFNMICKLNPDGNLIWSKLYNHGGIYGGGIVTTDNGMLYRTGDTFIKIDANGNVEWTKYGSSGGTYHYTTPLEVSDGYVYTKYLTSSRQVVFYKRDRLGNPSPGSAKVSNYEGVYPRLKLTPSGTIAGIFNPGGTPTLVELDKDLNVIRQGSVSMPGVALTAYDFCFSGDEPVIAGSTGNSTMFFAKLDDLFKSSCDTILPQMQVTQDTAYHNTFATNVSAHSLLEVDHNYSYVDVLDEQYTVCTVPLQLEIGPDITICNTSSHLLRNNLLGLFDEYKWSTGESTPYITVNDPGQYWVEARQYCEDSIVTDTINISVDSVPVTGWENAFIECENSFTVLRAPDCSLCIYEWNTGETSDSLVVTEPGSYILNIENSNQCRLADTVEVKFSKCECDFYIPNSFTPNGDGINEVFKPVYYCEMTNYELKIYNRLGKMVFKSSDPEEGWSGYYKDSGGISDIYNFTVQYTPVIKGKVSGAIAKSGMVALIY